MMPQSYREQLKRFGSSAPARASVEASTEVRWPPGITPEDIESMNRKMEAIGDWLIESRAEALLLIKDEEQRNLPTLRSSHLMADITKQPRRN